MLDEFRSTETPTRKDGTPGKTWHGELFYARYPKEKMLEAILLGEVSVNGTTMKTLDALGLGFDS